MECKFVVGQKVVCVDNSGAGAYWLAHGAIYTIRGFSTIDNHLFVLLEEVPPNPMTRTDWPGWYPRRFKPLQETKTDISSLQKLTRPNRVKKKTLENV